MRDAGRPKEAIATHLRKPWKRTYQQSSYKRQSAARAGVGRDSGIDWCSWVLNDSCQSIIKSICLVPEGWDIGVISMA